MEATQDTPTRRLADILLGDDGPLGQFVIARRVRPAPGRPRRSWRLIARDLLEATGGEIDLTGESLRQWFPTADADADALAQQAGTAA